MQDTDKTKGIMLAYEVFYSLRRNEFKDMSKDEIDGFRETMQAFMEVLPTMNLKKEY